MHCVVDLPFANPAYREAESSLMQMQLQTVNQSTFTQLTLAHVSLGATLIGSDQGRPVVHSNVPAARIRVVDAGSRRTMSRLT